MTERARPLKRYESVHVGALIRQKGRRGRGFCDCRCPRENFYKLWNKRGKLVQIRLSKRVCTQSRANERATLSFPKFDRNDKMAHGRKLTANLCPWSKWGFNNLMPKAWGYPDLKIHTPTNTMRQLFFLNLSLFQTWNSGDAHRSNICQLGADSSVNVREGSVWEHVQLNGSWSYLCFNYFFPKQKGLHWCFPIENKRSMYIFNTSCRVLQNIFYILLLMCLYLGGTWSPKHRLSSLSPLYGLTDGTSTTVLFTV